MSRWLITQWIFVGLAAIALLLWGAVLLRHLVRALRCEYTIPTMHPPARDIVEVAAADAVAAGISRITVYRAVNGVEIRLEDHGYDPASGKGILAKHFGSSIAIDPKVSITRWERIIRWEMFVNGIGRKMSKLRGKHEITGREEWFKAKGLL